MKNPDSAVPPVLDASAVLAVLFGEAGMDAVRAAGPLLTMSAVNAAEVLSKLVRDGVPVETAVEALESMDLELAPFGENEAIETARLATVKGLSLGDRACLATARIHNAEALTADRHWKDAAPEYCVTLIR